jgi:hypothetical protein
MEISMKDFTIKERRAEFFFKPWYAYYCVVIISMPSYSYVASTTGQKKHKICSLKEISWSSAIEIPSPPQYWQEICVFW